MTTCCSHANRGKCKSLVAKQLHRKKLQPKCGRNASEIILGIRLLSFWSTIYAARRSEGLQFFLEKLVTDGRQPGETLQAVHIYSSYRAFSGTGDGTAASIRKELREGVTRMIAGIGSVVPNLEIQVHLFHEADLPNDRWLRVDDNIIELGHGLEILEPTRSQAFSFKLAGETQAGKDKSHNSSSFARITETMTRFRTGHLVLVFALVHGGTGVRVLG